MKDKYLRKNEFRYDSNPEIRNPRGQGHVAYVTVKHKKHSKVNIITHAKTFFGEPTIELSENPDRTKPNSASSRPSRFSIPVWEHNMHLKNPAQGNWKMCKNDRRKIRKFNRKYARRKGK